MDTRSLELTAELCELAGSPNLFAYLGVPEDTSADDLKEKLKARRKYMQGMQSNPKYKKEAIFLIKHFGTLEKVLGAPDAYLIDAKHRAESQHIPVLELTIKGVLGGSSDLNPEQEDYLRRTAGQMGVSEPTFEALLAKLCEEANVTRGKSEPEQPSVDLAELASTDLYHLLGVAPMANRDAIYAAYRQRKAEARQVVDTQRSNAMMERIETAWKVLSDAEARQRYDLAWKRTGPPARARESFGPNRVGPPGSGGSGTTAPPIAGRSILPQTPSQVVAAQPAAARPGRVEVLGDQVRQVVVGSSPTLIDVSIRNGGEQPVNGTIRADVPWLEVYPSRLDPTFTDQLVRVTVVPDRMPARQVTGEVRIETERGQVISVTIDARRSLPIGLVVVGAVGALLLAGLVLLTLLSIPRGGPTTPPGLTIRVDPGATEVKLNDVRVGAGTNIFVPNPPTGDVAIEVHHPNFKPHKRTITIAAGTQDTVEVALALSAPMNCRPSADPSLKKAQYNLEEAQIIMGPIRASIDSCVTQAGDKPQLLTGTVRVHIDKSGIACGVESQGAGLDKPGTTDCITRAAAAAVFKPLNDGDYATVRYDYNVTAP